MNRPLILFKAPSAKRNSPATPDADGVRVGRGASPHLLDSVEKS